MTTKAKGQDASGEDGGETIDVYVDLRSPFSYIAKDGIRELARAFDVALVWRPYEIDIAAAFGADGARDARELRKVKYVYMDARRLAKPLGLDGMYVGAPQEELHRAAQLLWPKRGVLEPGLPRPVVRALLSAGAPGLEEGARLIGVELDIRSILDALAPRGINEFDFGAEETLRASIPAANGLFTARSLARMYAALAGWGEIDGVRILSRAAVERMSQLQVRTADRVIPVKMGWRLGYHTAFTFKGRLRSAFGHFGFGGSGAWADPSRRLAVAMTNNSVGGTPFGDIRIAAIGSAVLEAEKPLRGLNDADGLLEPDLYAVA